MPEFEDAPPTPRSAAADPSPKRKRPGCLAVFLLALLALVPLGLLLLNGPGFRTLARVAGLKAAASKGLAGDFRVTGSLWSGFGLEGVELSADGKSGTLVKLEDLRLDYRAPALVRGAKRLDWLDGLRVGKAEIRIFLPEPGTASGKTAKSSHAESAKTVAASDFSPLWNLLAADLAIDDLTLFVHQGDRVWSLESLRLDLPGKGDGSLKIARISLPGRAPLEGIDAVLRKEAHSLSIGPLPLLGYAELESLAIAEPEPGAFSILAGLGLAGGKADLSLQAERGEPLVVTLALRRGSSLSLDQIPLPDPKLRGAVTDLDLRFQGDPARPATWGLDGKLVASRTGWGEATADSLMLLARGNRIEVEAMRGRATLQADAVLPFPQSETTADLAQHPLLLQAAVDVPALEESLADFGAQVPLSGSASLRARDLLVTGSKVGTGELELVTDGLAWGGVALSGASLSARVERENFIRLALDLGLDEHSRAHLAATIDATARRYEGKASVALDTRGRLGTVLRDLGKSGFSGAAALDWTGRGDFSASGHVGEAALALKSFAIGSGRPIDGTLAAGYSDRHATLTTLSLSAEGVSLSGSGEWDGTVLRLPDWKLSHGDRTPLTLALQMPLEPGHEGGLLAQAGPLALDLSLDGLALDELTRFFAAAPPLAGTLDGGMKASGSFVDLDLAGRVAFHAETPDAPDKAPATATLDLSLRGEAARPASWVATLDALLSGLRWQGMALENIALEAATDTSRLERPLVATLRFDQSGTVLDARARLDLGEAPTLGDLASVPLQADASLEVGNLATLLRDLAPPKWKDLPLAGALSAKADGLRLKRGSLTAGAVSLQSESFAVEGKAFETVRIDATVPAPDEIEATTTLALDGRNRLEGRGRHHLKEGRYSGEVALDADLVAKDSRLRALLEDRPMAALLPGTTSLQWKGTGQLHETKHEGELSLKADSLRLAAGAEPLDAEIAGRYSADSADFPVLKIASAPLSFDGSLRWLEKQLTLSGKGASGGREALSLAATLPLDPETLKPEAWFGQHSPVSVALSANALSLGTVSRLFAEKPPLLGDLSLDLDISGTPAAPTLGLDLGLDGIAVPREGESLPAGRLSLKAETQEARLSLSGEYRHPDVKPLTLSASLPFHPGAWTTGGRKIGDETIAATARMEHSSLAFLAGQIPGIESISGDVALDAEVSGTVSAPHLRGEAQLQIPKLRLEDRNAPSIQNVELLARFADDRVVLERLAAVVAGGTVEGKGEAVFQAGEEPRLGLSLKGSEVLLVRTPDVNVRTDLDLTLGGPWSQALVSGEIGITNSRFFKNFDLLPLGLPTRRVESALPTVERSPRGGGAAYQDLDFGVKAAPFQDWPVAVRVFTKDPFLIRSNLAESSITADLRLAGTLGAPQPTGRVEIEKGEMSLPFSKVDVETGRIEFDEATGFNGAIEFKARAKADRYQIAIYLYDRILSPQYVLTSIPPLPSEDILTLIATGTTRDELVGGDAESLAAGKAAGLLLKNLRKKSNEAEADPTLLDLLEERTELELGRVNQETGEQTFGGKIRLWKQLFFVGDVDQQSDYRALLKYVFRFE